MKSKPTFSFFENFLPVLGKRWVYHSLFWGMLVVGFSFLEMSLSGIGFFHALTNNVLRLVILGIAVYYNVYVLVPNYLARKRFFPYMGMLLLLTFVVTPIESFVLFIKSAEKPELQASILSQINLAFIPNFLLLGASTIVKITTDWYKNMREQQVIETQAMQSELRFLKSQINPHFLFNTLNSLYALTLKKSDKAPEIVLKLSEMMRYMLYECNERQVLLSKEVNYIRNYLDLERMRHGKQMSIEFKVEGNIRNQMTAPLLFIPFVENCFKHGLGQHIEKGFVHIALKVQDDQLDLYVENSKSETLPRQRHARSGGIGLVNVRRRLELLYPQRHALNIRDNPDTYLVHLAIQLEP